MLHQKIGGYRKIRTSVTPFLCFKKDVMREPISGASISQVKSINPKPVKCGAASHPTIKSQEDKQTIDHIITIRKSTVTVEEIEVSISNLVCVAACI